MQPLVHAAPDAFRQVRFLLTDMDETLTYQGRLAAATYSALERLQEAGIRVIPVTAAPAGWCEQMARMWPVDGVIGENGGLFFQRGRHLHELQQSFWHPPVEHAQVKQRLEEIGRQILLRVPSARFAVDQHFRLTSLAFERNEDFEQQAQIIQALRDAGAEVTVNNLWLLGWLGRYDKLAMSRRILAEIYDLDIDQDGEQVLYCGDSTNDGPMFAFFRNTIGVSTVRQYLHELHVAPAWITDGPGGAGFVEVANVLLGHRRATFA